MCVLTTHPFLVPDVAQTVGRGIALLFHDRGTGRGEWSAARPGRTLPRGKTGTHLTGEWLGPKSGLYGRKISTHRDTIPDRPAHSQSLCRLSYPVHLPIYIYI